MEKTRRAIIGSIATMNEAHPHAEAIVYENDKILFVGSENEAKSYINDQTDVQKLDKEYLVLPGLIDTHMHPILGGLEDYMVNFKEDLDPPGFQKQLKEYIEEHKEAKIILGSGIHQAFFPNEKIHRKFIDEVCSDKPVILWRSGLHAVALNTKALEMCNITKDTNVAHFEDSNSIIPYNFWHETAVGVIDKDENGDITGLLIDNAINLVKPIAPEITEKELEKAFEKAHFLLLSEGITTYIDACVKPCLQSVYKRKYTEEEDKLPRCVLTIGWCNRTKEFIFNEKYKEKSFSEFVGIPESDKLQVNSVKFFVDGTVQNETAYVYHQYKQTHHYHGRKNFSQEELTEYATKLHSRGIRCHFHVMGDHAVEMAALAMEKAHQVKLPDPPRHIFAHIRLARKEDIEKLEGMEVSANFTAYSCSKDTTGKFIDGRVELIQYPIKEFVKRNINVCYGSDWPVTDVYPIDNMEVAVTRKPLGAGEDVEAIDKNQRIDVMQALRGYTIDAAYAISMEKEIGSLEVGKKADIVVLTKNILKCHPSEIHEAKVLQTIVAGKVLFEKKDKE